jgi:hypothetical protein
MQKLSSKPFLKAPYVLGLLLVFGVVILVLEFTDTTHLFHSSKTTAKPVSAGQFTKGEKDPGSDSSSSTTSKSNTASANTSSETGSNKDSGGVTRELIEPSGTFVSAHKNVPSDANLSSVCNTSVGAKCSIVFTSGGVSKSLYTQTADSGGAAYWNSWTPQSIGLTPGTWQVKAVATLGSSTKTSVDSLNLEIAQ